MRRPYQRPLYISPSPQQNSVAVWSDSFDHPPQSSAADHLLPPVLISCPRLRCRRRRHCSARTTRQHAVGGSEFAWQTKQWQYSSDESIGCIRPLLYSSWVYCLFHEQIMSKNRTELIGSIRSRTDLSRRDLNSPQAFQLRLAGLHVLQPPRRPTAWRETRRAAIRPPTVRSDQTRL
jgi:hypothetical protein